MLRAVPVIDGHNDLPWAIRENAAGDVEAYDLRARTRGATDLERLREGGVDGQFWSVYVPADLPGGFARTQLEQIDLARRGWSDEDLGKLASGNVLRAMRRVEAVAARLRKARPASTATIETLDGLGV